VTMSVAHKRRSQVEVEATVIEQPFQVRFLLEGPSTEEREFLASLAVSRLASLDMFRLYDGIFARFAALEAARISGTFALPGTPERVTTVRDALNKHAQLQRDIEMLRSRAAKERQINRRVELNLEIKRLEEGLSRALDMLRTGTQL
jgi:hypothetical protein